MKTKQSRNRSKDLTSSEKMSDPLLYARPNKREHQEKASSHYQPNLPQAELYE